MIVPSAIRARYEAVLPYVTDIQKRASATLLRFCGEQSYQFEGRIKSLESVAEKIESGRFRHAPRPPPRPFVSSWRTRGIPTRDLHCTGSSIWANHQHWGTQPELDVREAQGLGQYALRALQAVCAPAPQAPRALRRARVAGRNMAWGRDRAEDSEPRRGRGSFQTCDRAAQPRLKLFATSCIPFV